MNEQAKAAVRERISLGYQKEKIIQELESAGYSTELATELYITVINESGENAPPVNNEERETTSATNEEVVSEKSTEDLPPETPAVAEAEPKPESSEAVFTVSDEDGMHSVPKHRNLERVLIVIVVILIIAAAGIAYMIMSGSGGLDSLKNKFSSLFQSAPYSNETEIMEAMIDRGNNLTAHGFNLDYHFAIEDREADTKTFDNNAIPKEVREDFLDQISMAAAMGAFPAEVDARMSMSGVMNAVDKENPEFDISGEMNFLAEPIILSGAGSVRMVDGVLYGKVDDVPANLEMYLGGVPTDTWIIVAEESGAFNLPIGPSLPIKTQQVLNFIPQEVKQVLTQELKRMAYLPLGLAQRSNDYLSNQAAQLGGAPLLGVISDEEDQLQKRFEELLIEYPLIKLVGRPEQVELNGEKVYRYDLDIDFENLRAFLSGMFSEIEEMAGSAGMPSETELRMLFAGSEPVLDEINRLTDISQFFRSDGSSAGFSFTSKFTLDHPDVEQQFLFDMNMTTTRQNDALEIEAPEDVYEKTLEEIVQEQMGQTYGFQNSPEPEIPSDEEIQEKCKGDTECEELVKRLTSGDCEQDVVCESLMKARAEGRDASIKQSLISMRSQAEVYFSNNDYNYGDVCTDPVIQELIMAVVANYDVMPETDRDGASGSNKLVCNDQDTSYAISVPLVSDKNTAWCVDSTGFAGEASPNALSSGTDTSCN